MDDIALSEIRKQYEISQAKAAEILNIPLRTYVRYEADSTYGSDLKRKAMIKELINHLEITETKGLLSIRAIKDLLAQLFDSDEYKGKILFCYLFGSYAKGYATESSDVDLCVSTSLAGLEFAGLSEAIRNALHKKIDLIRFSNLKNNIDLINEIMKDGIKIYG